MRLPMTLSLYLGRQFLWAVALTALIMILIIGLLDLLELIRRASTVARPVPFYMIVEMTLMKLPTDAERIYPFAFLIGGMVALTRLTRNSELVVTRAAGVSVWQFLAPGVLMALISGLLLVMVMNPIAAALISKFDRLEGKYISGKASLLSISPSGLWLRQVGEEGIRFRNAVVPEYILHAMRMDQTSLQLEDVNIFLFDAKHRFLGRIDAPVASLTAGRWSMANATLSAVDTTPQNVVEYHMPTQLTLSQIQDSFSAPETFSFWQLPSFIGVLEKAGFSALQHRLHFHQLMALPVLLAGMFMLAAVFSLRSARRGRTGMVVVVGIISGYVFYFAANVIYTLGSSGSLPIALAAWAPSLVVVMFASAALLHLEDG